MGSGYTRAVDLANTFVSTHATGARSHTPRERAHSPRQLQTARSAADRVSELARCALRSAAGLGEGCVVAGSPGAQDARHALCSPDGVRTADPALERQRWGRRPRGSEELSSLVQGRRGRSEYRAELGSLRTLFLSLRRARSNMSPSHRHPYSLPHLLFLL